MTTDSEAEPKRSQSIYRDLAPLGDLLCGRRYCGDGLSWRSAIKFTDRAASFGDRPA
jgi:hypothetical protein